jgi:hypothetical protein
MHVCPIRVKAGHYLHTTQEPNRNLSKSWYWIKLVIMQTEIPRIPSYRTS